MKGSSEALCFGGHVLHVLTRVTYLLHFPLHTDVWAPEMATHYGEVFWTDQGETPLPPDIVKRFDGKVMALMGYEQVRRVCSRLPGHSLPLVHIPLFSPLLVLFTCTQFLSVVLCCCSR